MTSEEWTATIVAGHQHADQVRNGGGTKKMLKMKIEPNMCMKTQGSYDKMAEQFIGLFCLICTIFAKIDENPAGILAESEQIKR